MADHNPEDVAALIELVERILAPGDDDNVTLGQLRAEYGITRGMTVFDRFPNAFNERQQPVCGVWNPLLGPCICGNPDGHDEDGALR